MPAVFVDDDQGYETWLARNSGGYVVNAYRHPTASYLLLHRSSCRTISGEPARGKTWTTGQYLKVCASSIAELARWARLETGGALQPCGICHPPV